MASPQTTKPTSYPPPPTSCAKTQILETRSNKLPALQKGVIVWILLGEKRMQSAQRHPVAASDIGIRLCMDSTCMADPIIDQVKVHPIPESTRGGHNIRQGLARCLFYVFKATHPHHSHRLGHEPRNLSQDNGYGCHPFRRHRDHFDLPGRCMQANPTHVAERAWDDLGAPPRIPKKANLTTLRA